MAINKCCMKTIITNRLSFSMKEGEIYIIYIYEFGCQDKVLMRPCNQMASRINIVRGPKRPKSHKKVELLVGLFQNK